MIASQIRRVVFLIQSETGRSAKEILEAIVRAVHSSIIDYQERFCPLCASKRMETKSTRSSENEIVRSHKCGFCGATFRSVEKLAVTVTENLTQPIAKPPAKKQNKKRGKKSS
jgi:DNA-directed RNA polymerase subunit RPC12/RpoP